MAPHRDVLDDEGSQGAREGAHEAVGELGGHGADQYHLHAQGAQVPGGREDEQACDWWWWWW